MRTTELYYGELHPPNADEHEIVHEYQLKHINLADVEPCSHCGARLFAEENRNLCCQGGKKVLHRLAPLPPTLKTLFTQPNLLKHQRGINNRLAFTAMGSKRQAPTMWARIGFGALTLAGRPYHRVFDGYADYAPGTENLARLYMTGEENTQGTLAGIPIDLMGRVQQSMREFNPWVAQYRTAAAACSHAQPGRIVFQTAVSRRTHGAILGDVPPCDAVAAVLMRNESATGAPSTREIYTYPVRPAGTAGTASVQPQPRFISLGSRLLEPLSWPLIFPLGEIGWDKKDKRDAGTGTFDVSGQNCLNIGDYACQRLLADRQRMQTFALLSQEWVCDLFARQEELNLDYLRGAHGQRVICKYSDAMQAAQAASGQTDPAVADDIGARLPAGHKGSKATKRNLVQDAMAVMHRYGAPDLCITFTTNPNWDEIQNNLLPGQTAVEDPALVCRVFRLKLDQLLKELRSGSVFGPLVYVMAVTEFQKRGLPHAHIILKFKESAQQRGAVHDWVWAHIPDINLYPAEHAAVLKFMIHNPCTSSVNRNAVCQTDQNGTRRCGKHFPQPLRDNTSIENATGRALYRRPAMQPLPYKFYCSKTSKWIQTTIDNTWVVPYNAYLLTRFNAHMCVDYVTNEKVVLYLYKYVYKGPDFAVTGVFAESESGPVTIEEYSTARYISATDACWHLLGNDMQRRSHSVQSLKVCLPGDEAVVSSPQSTIANLVQLAETAREKTDLHRYFNRNQHYDGGCLRELTYAQYWEQYCYSPNGPTGRAIPNEGTTPANVAGPVAWHKDFLGNWIHKRTAGTFLTRISSFSIARNPEAWYCRLLLLHVPATSYPQLRKFEGRVYDTFEAASRARGLVTDDGEFKMCIDEASRDSTAACVRALFVTLVLAGAPAFTLWTQTVDHLIADFAQPVGMYDITTTVGYQAAVGNALQHIDRMLHTHDKSCSEIGLPEPPSTYREVQRHRQTLDNERLENQATANRLMPTLSTEQREFVEHTLRIVQAYSEDHHPPQQAVFLDAPGGFGKTHALNTLLAALCSQGAIVLATASSGIAALNFTHGKTAHSTFKIPLEVTATSYCNITPIMQRAELLRATQLIVWDEISMAHVHAVTAVDRTLRRLLKVDSFMVCKFSWGRLAHA